MFHSVVGNEQRFPLLLGTKNAFRIFMVSLETKSALVMKISQLYCLFTVWDSDLFNICLFGRLDFFFSGDITKISGNITQVSGDMTSGEMTLGRLDRLPSTVSNIKAVRIKYMITSEIRSGSSIQLSLSVSEGRYRERYGEYAYCY